MKLKEVMLQKGISQAYLSRMADINQSQLNRAINGFQNFFPAWRKKISDALNMPEAELFPEYQARKEA